MDIKAFLATYKNILIVAVLIIVLFIYLLYVTIPTIMKIVEDNKNYKNAVTTLADKQKQLEEIKERIKQEEASDKGMMKEFFRPIDKVLDTESSIANEFAEILVILRTNSIKTRSIEYAYDPSDDKFIQNVPGTYNAALLKIQMIGTYKNFESFLKELYKHEHFIDIVSVEIVPYEKNKRILLINFQMKLYAQK